MGTVGSDQPATTLSTLPGVLPLCKRSSSRWHASRGPCTTTCTRPSGRFEAYPVNPSSNARALVHHPKLTGCTEPCTHAVIWTSPSLHNGSAPLSSRKRLIDHLEIDRRAGLQRPAHGADLIDRPTDDRDQPSHLVLSQTGHVHLEGFLEQWVNLVVTISRTRYSDSSGVVVAEATGQRMVAAHSGAGGQRDLHQLAGREHALDILRAHQHLSAARAATGVPPHTGALRPQFRHPISTFRGERNGIPARYQRTITTRELANALTCGDTAQTPCQYAVSTQQFRQSRS